MPGSETAPLPGEPPVLDAPPLVELPPVAAAPAEALSLPWLAQQAKNRDSNPTRSASGGFTPRVCLTLGAAGSGNVDGELVQSLSFERELAHRALNRAVETEARRRSQERTGARQTGRHARRAAPRCRVELRLGGVSEELRCPTGRIE